MQRVLRYWHTLRYLRPVQFYGRLWFRLYKPKPDRRKAPLKRPATGGWVLAAERPASLLGAVTFSFLNVTYQLNEVGWNSTVPEKLWVYNLHYFDDLNAAGAASRYEWHRTLLAQWVAENPAGDGVGWEPYPTSLRIVNWIKWALAGNELPEVCVESLAVQARWLMGRLEFHLLGNHLFANAKALLFAALFFSGAEADLWLKRALGILKKEVGEQLLADGGHFERSTMYQSIFLEDMLDLINLAGAWPGRIDTMEVSRWRDAASGMLGWMEGMRHPDGEIAFFNDAAPGIAPKPAALRAYAGKLGLHPAYPKAGGAGVTMHRFTESGYIRLASPTAVALLDVAPVGPDYLPGHAHADTLSFEMSLFGQRVVVNGGTSCYGLGPERLRERQTRSHSTVEVDAQSSSEVWGGFRVARRAYPFGLQLTLNNGCWIVGCSHDGYKRLVGQPVHHREWQMEENSLLVSDSVVGGAYPAVARFLFHPSLRVSEKGAGSWLVVFPAGHGMEVKVLFGKGSLVSDHYAPEFGKVLPAQALAVVLVGGKSRTQFIWN